MGRRELIDNRQKTIINTGLFYKYKMKLGICKPIINIGYL